MLKAIANRTSTRKYNDTPVENEKILQLLESARMAPSGKNTQPWHFIIVTNEETKAKIAEANHNQQWMNDAPVFIVCVADIRARISDDRDVYVDENSDLPELKQVIRDTAVAIEHILLEAENIGLCSCWTGWYLQKDMRPIMGIPDDKYVVGVVTIGYNDEPGAGAQRRSLDDMIRYEKW